MIDEDPILIPHLDELEMAGAENGEAGYSDMLETICGTTDDSQPVEQYDGNLGVTRAFVDTHQPMVAQVQWNANLPYTNPGNVAGVRWGTGTMISPDLFLTAGHLFDQTGGGWNRPRVNGTSNVISPQEIATNMHLNFNYQVDPSGTLRAEQSFAITQLVEYRLGGVDFAVCRIAGSPGNTFGYSNVATADAAEGDMLCIMGHPLGVPKRIEAGPLVDFDGNRVLYNDIDTMGGNSGSGILQASSGRIVGVHTNGGCNASGTGHNFGMRISAIRTNSPTVRSLGRIRTNPAVDGILTLRTGDLVATTAIKDSITSAIGDVIATSPSKDFLRTNPSLDRGVLTGPGGDRPLFDPGPGPVINPQLGGVRPFVLSTPHHSSVIPEQEATDEEPTAEDYAYALTQLEADIEQRQEELAQVAAHYEAVRAEYESVLGG